MSADEHRQDLAAVALGCRRERDGSQRIQSGSDVPDCIAAQPMGPYVDVVDSATIDNNGILEHVGLARIRVLLSRQAWPRGWFDKTKLNRVTQRARGRLRHQRV